MLTKVDSIPKIFAVAGSPGSGKTSFIQQKMKENFFCENVFIHDCDAVMESLEGYQKDLSMLGTVKAFEKWEIPARKIAEAALEQAVQQKKDIIYDRSCALESSYLFLKEVVENHGYTLVMHALYVTKENALLRAKEREKNTGRHIPEEVLLERMEGIKNLWSLYLKLSKECYLYNGNSRDLQVIAQSKGADLFIFDQKMYSLFVGI